MRPEMAVRLGASAGSLVGWIAARRSGVAEWYPHVVIGGLLGALAASALTD